MTSERWEKIKAIFLDAITRPEPEQDEFLTTACVNDTQLRDEVEKMMKTHTQLGSFMERPSLVKPAYALSQKLLGAYRVVGPISEGGMGAVFEGVRDDGRYSRRVAIKLIRPGYRSKDIVKQFARETQLLATLDHPNIARLLDGGTSEDGDPYVVMEYVDGIPVDKYCDSKKLTIDERLTLFRTICAAVQYAHQNLVVHRDLKPNNILVLSDGTPKLLDFGIATVLGTDEDFGGSELTRAGLHFATPEYSSPEQLRNERVTTVSDVYALGVLLYKLLTGRSPYSFTSRLSHDIVRVVCDEEPQRPSSQQLPAQQNRQDSSIEEASALRRITPDKMHRLLSGDLDTILLKALQKDPQRRYLSAENFAEDIRRHQEGLPVLARRDSFMYRARKFISRNKVGVAAAVLIVLLLIGGMAGTLWQAKKAGEEASVARTERRKAEQINALIQQMLSSVDPREMGKDVTVSQVLGHAAGRVGNELHGQPEIQVAALLTISEMYSMLGFYDRSAEQLQRSLKISHTVHGDRHPDIARAIAGLAYVSQKTGHYARADSLFSVAVTMYRETATRPDKYLAGMLNDWGTSLYSQHSNDRALQLLREAAEVYLSTGVQKDRGYAAILTSLGPALTSARQFAAAESVYREAFEIQKRTSTANDVDLSYTTNNLAFVFVERGNLDSAEAMFRQSARIRKEVFGESHPEYGISLTNLAGLLIARGKLEEAETLAIEAHNIFQKTLGEKSLELSSAKFLWGRVLRMKGNNADAEPLIKDALTTRKNTFPGTAPAVTKVQVEYGNCLIALGRLNDAEHELGLALASIQAAGSGNDPLERDVLKSLVDLYKKAGKKEKAQEFEAKLGQLDVASQ